MTNKNWIKGLIDGGMLILYILFMGKSITGNRINEMIGVAFFILFVIHCISHADWFSQVIHNLECYKGFIIRSWILINFLSVIDMILLFLSSIAVSNFLFSFIPMPGSLTVWSYIHQVTMYVGLILISIHIGFHWSMIMHHTKKLMGMNTPTQFRRVLAQVITCVIVIFGIRASFGRSIGSKFLFESASADATQVEQQLDVPDNIPDQDVEEQPNQDQQDIPQDTPEDGNNQDDQQNSAPNDGSSQDDSVDNNQVDNQNGNSKISYKTSINKQSDTNGVSKPGASSDASKSTATGDAASIISSGDAKEIPTTSVTMEKPESDDLLHLFFDYFNIIGMYVAGTHYSVKLLRKRELKIKKMK